MKRISSFVVLLLCIIISSAAQKKTSNYTVIVSLDAFRWDYSGMYSTPNLDAMARQGVKAVMQPSYPASTFPNHYTIATGLVPDHHGIVNNSFWDPKHNILYTMGDSATRYNPYYYLGEPIWITAQKQGVKTGNVYWVASDISIKSTYPTYYRKWRDEPRLDFAQRVDDAIRLLSLPEEKRPRLVMVYFDEPDYSGHVYGPHSKEVKRKIASLDSLMGIFRQKIKKLPIGKRVNLIVTADHGMTEISDNRLVKIDQYIKNEWCEHIIGTNPTSIFTKPNCRDSVLNALRDVQHIYVWKKEAVPDSLHYGTSDRLGDIIVAPELGWQFAFESRHLKGAHGYFPQHSDMKVLFRACGPDFKRGYVSKEFINVDIYPLLCHLLGITPAKNDGRWERIKDITKE
jgi:predicted AlkP superfamily pyrophosphatase or phosphodiesterase